MRKRERSGGSGGDMRSLLWLSLWPLVWALEGPEAPENAFFVAEIFEKYGNHNYITYEGFEHLLENLGLGRLVFETKHDVSIHKINGTFLEFHDELSLHKHNHSIEKKRHATEIERGRGKRSLEEFKSGSESTVEKTLRRKCLTAQDILTVYGLHPYHDVIISPSKYIHMCPAIVYELDQKLCQSKETSRDSENVSEDRRLVWVYATMSMFLMATAGMLCILVVPLMRKKDQSPFLQFLVALAVGTLCGDALVHLLPQVYSVVSKMESNTMTTSRGTVAVLAVLVFFIVENVIKNIQHQKPENIEELKEVGVMLPRGDDCGPGDHGHHHGVNSIAWMAIMGDILHNVTDGLSIGAAFRSNLASGFASSIAIFCHELPHELGDYAILLASGMSIKKSLFYNLLSSVFSFVGMAVGVVLGEMKDAALWINAFTAGTFLYIALSDLVPEMKKMASKPNSTNFLVQTTGLTFGGILMFCIALYEDEIENLLRS